MWCFVQREQNTHILCTNMNTQSSSNIKIIIIYFTFQDAGGFASGVFNSEKSLRDWSATTAHISMELNWVPFRVDHGTGPLGLHPPCPKLFPFTWLHRLFDLPRRVTETNARLCQHSFPLDTLKSRRNACTDQTDAPACTCWFTSNRREENHHKAVRPSQIAYTKGQPKGSSHVRLD